jgi:SAM-dependent methyltransferase
MSFKKYRAKKYDKLKWVNNDKYIKDIVMFANPKKDDLVLDVGTGTGVIANAFEPYVKQVIGIDVSKEMLAKKHGTFPAIVWDIQKPLFEDFTFDIVVSRMAFHHIERLGASVFRCFSCLKNKGNIVIAEGIPPTEEKHVVDWFTEMFKLKEDRHIFTTTFLRCLLVNAGFQDIKVRLNIIKDFSINNWLANSGLSKRTINKIKNMHINATAPIKEAFNMRFVKGDIIIKSTNLIIKGTKHVV